MIRKRHGRIVSKKCGHVRFPNHSQRSRRTQFGAFLMKNMRSKNGSLFLHPKNLYCFKKLSDSLRSLLTRPGFLENCESWRKRKPTGDSMADVFDGKVWKEFLDLFAEKFANKFAKKVLRKNVSSKEALKTLKWLPLECRRRGHRRELVQNAIKGNIPEHFDNFRSPLNSSHGYNTRNGYLPRLPKVKSDWGRRITSFQAFNDWMAFPMDLRRPMP